MSCGRIVMGIWNYIKNSGRFNAACYTLEWVGSLPDKRESRRMDTAYLLSQEDVLRHTDFADGGFYGGWYMDFHPAEGIGSDEDNCTQIPVNVYAVPLRCLYHADFPNLLFAGRNIGTRREAFVSTRVMNTCGLSGQAAAALAHTTVRGRFEVVEGLPGRTFIVDYSHNGLALTSALKTLRAYHPHRLICVFGTVGGRTQVRRRELAEAASAWADYSILTSDNPDFEDPMAILRDIDRHMAPDAQYEIIPDRAEAIRAAVAMAQEGDIVLFAGKGHEDYQIIQGKKIPFVERDLIREACRLLS